MNKKIYNIPRVELVSYKAMTFLCGSKDTPTPDITPTPGGGGKPTPASGAPQRVY